MNALTIDVEDYHNLVVRLDLDARLRDEVGDVRTSWVRMSSTT